MEILAPAGSPQALYAAVYAGADAVYFGAGSFNARKNAKNFSHDEAAQAIDFCREKGVKTNIVLNTLVSQNELEAALSEAEFFAKAGASEFIVQDMGLFSALKAQTNVPLCASTQLTCHSLDGAAALADLGFSRIVLSRELEKGDIAKIVRGTNAEIEVFAHGALCMCYSGQCYMSSVIGTRSGNRGLCAQPCRLPYNGGYRLSLKDLSLLEYVKELENIGVASLKIEGRMKSPEYVYAVTRAFADAKHGEPYTQKKEQELARVFSRGDGFTKGYYLGSVGKKMFGTRSENATEQKVVIDKNGYKRIGLCVQASVEDGHSMRVFAETDDGLAAETLFEGQVPESTQSGLADIEAAFSRLGGTPYYLKKAEFSGGMVFMPRSLLNAARRKLIDDITAMRKINTNYFKPRKPTYENASPTATRLEAVFSSVSQIPENADKLSKIWLPIGVLCGKHGITAAAGLENVGAVMPRICEDREYPTLEKQLAQLKENGITSVLCGNIGQAATLCRRGFTVYGDFGLNIFNAVARDAYFQMGLSTLTLSFEANMAQIYDMSTENTGIIAYGRLPFMIMRNCVKSDCRKSEFLTDRMRKNFLLTCAFGCRNELYNADRLWLADKALKPLGFERLLFTDEEKNEAYAVIEAYSGGDTTPPDSITRGLYYKKV